MEAATPLTQFRTQRVLVETDRHRITGSMTLARDGYRSRISDLLNAGERDFLSLTDVTVTALDGDGASREHEFMVLSRQHIVLVVPEDGGQSAPRLSAVE